MELISAEPRFNLYDPHWPFWTYQEQLPPAKFVFDEDGRRGMAVDSMVSGGCIISGAAVRRSLLFSNVRVRSYSTVEDSVILPGVDVGRRCRLKNTIVDRGCWIPDGMVIGHDRDQDIASGFRVSRNGTVLVTRGMLGQPEGYA